jgi:hypothetical protein
MLTLDQLQRRICSAVQGHHKPDLLELIACDRITPEARLQIYRNHTILTLTEALKATFPVICRLVDERFFSYAAHEFIRDSFPSKPCLIDYGEGFSDFLASFPACRDLVYLPDVARLEWAINTALHAPEAQPLERLALAAPDPVVSLHPSFRLVMSRWPIDLIWRANQPEGNPETVIDLDAGGTQLQVYRRGDRVVITRIDQGRYAFLAALVDGVPLPQALEVGASADPMFDPAECLDLLFEEGLIVQPMPTAPATSHEIGSSG